MRSQLAVLLQRAVLYEVMQTPLRASLPLGSILGTLWLAGCAGRQPSVDDAASPAARSSRRAPPGADPAKAALADQAASGGAQSAEGGYDDPEEVSDPATLKPVFSRGQSPSFSKGTVSERECWQTVALTGEARRDYASLVERCGTPTGSVEYAKPAMGSLDHLHDRRDTFIVFLRAGLCYRFFGVGDATIPNLDIVIERNGALQGEDRTRGPVAIINTDQAWCMDSDGEYRFVVQIGGEGHGRYVFGVWARPRT